jgi:hypothetical protein
MDEMAAAPEFETVGAVDLFKADATLKVAPGGFQHLVV